jgi:hypothetical protein
MPGLIETLGAQRAAERRTERGRLVAEEVKREADDAVRERERRREVRRIAMKVGRTLTGRVYFPALWDLTDQGVGVYTAKVNIERKVALVIEVSDSQPSAITVARFDWKARKVWEPPAYMRRSAMERGALATPGRRWFVDALEELGVI